PHTPERSRRARPSCSRAGAGRAPPRPCGRRSGARPDRPRLGCAPTAPTPSAALSPPPPPGAPPPRAPPMRPGSPSHLEGVEPPRAVEALQGELASLGEVVLAPEQEIAHGRRHEHVAGLGGLLHP